ATQGAKHGSVESRLRRRDRGIGIAHETVGDHAALHDQLWLDAEECRLPEHQVGHFAYFDGANVVSNPMRNSRINSIFRDVALHASIVVVALLLRQTPALTFHFVSSLPGA